MLHEILAAISKIEHLPPWVGEIILSVLIILALIVMGVR